MTGQALEIIAEVRRCGGRFWQEASGRLHVSARQPLPDDLVTRLKIASSEIAEILAAPPPLDADGLPYWPCRLCGGRDFWRVSNTAAGDDAFDPLAWRCWGCARPAAGVYTDGCSIPPQAPGLRVLAHAAPRHPCRQSSEVRSATP